MPLYVNLWVKRHHLSDLFPVISSQPFGEPLCVDDRCARHESLAQPPTASGITAKSPYSPVVVVKSSRNPFRSETRRLSATASIATSPLNAISSDACVFSPQISHNFVLPAINPACCISVQIICSWLVGPVWPLSQDGEREGGRRVSLTLGVVIALNCQGALPVEAHQLGIQ